MASDFKKGDPNEAGGRLHHEIYLSDARKVPPEKRRAVIRHPIRLKAETRRITSSPLKRRFRKALLRIPENML